MIDYFLKYADEATAKTALAQFLITDRDGVAQWPTDLCIPDVKIWRASQDVTTNVTGLGGETMPVVTHAYLPGFFILVSLDRIRPALVNLPAVQAVLDREKAVARQAGAVIKSNLSNAVLQDIRISPVFAGSDIPYGNMQ
jgi:hypothetical protein